MCIAIFQPAGKILTEEQLKNCSDRNKDGQGMAWIENGKLNVFKSMSFEIFKTKYFEIANVSGKISPMMIHFRFGTQGEKSELNCHPFYVNDNLVFCHNGVIPTAKDEKFSDTYLFNEEILKEVMKTENIHNTSIKFLLKEYIGVGNKLIFMDSSGNHSIINEPAGDWDGGIWFSNSNYKTYTYKPYGSSIYSNDSYWKKVCDFCGHATSPKERVKVEFEYSDRIICSKCIEKEGLKEAFEKIQKACYSDAFYANEDWSS